MLTFLLFLNDIIIIYNKNNGKNSVLPSEILSQFDFIISILTLKPNLSKFYSDCVNKFCLCRKCLRQKQHMRI